MKNFIFASLLAVLLLSPTPVHASEIYLTTPADGGNFFLHDTSPFVWLVTPTDDILLSGGMFWMKLGPDTKGDTTLSISGGGLSSSVDVLASQVQQQWSWIQYGFEPGAVQLLADQTYTITLSSTATSAANSHYFLKDPSRFTFNGGEIVDPQEPEVPEPATWGMMAGGIVLLAFSRRLRPRR